MPSIQIRTAWRDDRGQAEELTTRLLSDFRETSRLDRAAHELPGAPFRRTYASEKLGIPLADVEEHLDAAFVSLAFTVRHNLEYPCLVHPRIGSPVPVAVPGRTLASTRPVSLVRPLWKFLLGAAPTKWLGATVEGAQVRFLPPRVVPDLLHERLLAFLTVRFSARQSEGTSSPGLQFTVVTASHGLRVHYSPAYFFSPKTVFGGPSSPVVSWIQPGRYVFGAARPGSPPEFDLTGEYVVPDHRQAELSM